MMIQIGISACVLGEKVRYDGGHKQSDFCTDVLTKFVQFVPVCPEQAIGMGVPRPAIRLQQNRSGEIRLVNSKDSSLDFTVPMLEFTKQLLPKLTELSGYIVCAKSPSCGMERVRLTSEDGALLGKVGVGLYTRQLMQQFPWLPIEEDGRLMDLALRENFITRVYTLYAWQQMMAQGFSVGKLVQFHSQFKFLIMAHQPTAYRALGRLVAQAKLYSLDELAQRYRQELMDALKHLATRKQHANVLMHIQGFFKKMLTAAAKQELLTLIHQYRLGYAPLLAPLTLLQHHLRTYPHAYLAAQRYLAPFPAELGLRA